MSESERKRIEEWERLRYGRRPSQWPDLGFVREWRTVAQGPGEVVDIPWWGVAA